MRAHEILEEKNWKSLIGPAAYLAVNAGAYGLSQSGHGGDPDWLKAPQQQTQQGSSSVTVELDPARRDGPDHVHDDDGNRYEVTKPQASPQASTQSKDAKLLALTIWGEARSEGEAGMRAVGHVVKNRMKSDRFGDEVKDVVWKRKAFSCWNPNDPNREKMRNIAQLPKDSIEYKKWKMAQKIADEILANKSKDPTRGALFYHTEDIKPKWADPKKAIAKVANHIFYRTDLKLPSPKLQG